MTDLANGFICHELGAVLARYAEGVEVASLEQRSRESYLHISPGSEPCLQFLVGGRAGPSLGNSPELRGKHTQNTHVSAFSPTLTTSFFFNSSVLQ